MQLRTLAIAILVAAPLADQTLQVPYGTAYTLTNLAAVAGYLDPGAPNGISASAGIDTTIR